MADEEKNKGVEIDLSDMSLEGETLEGLNPDADAFATPPPLPELGPDGKKIRYRVRLAFQEGGKWMKRETNAGKEYYQSPAIDATVIDEGGQFDGYHLFDSFISTLVMERQGTNRMAGILRELGVQVAARWTTPELARKFKEVIEGNPECLVEVEWSAFSQESNEGKGATVLRGQRRWPKKADGSYNHVATYEKTKEELTARANISRYIKVS